MTIAPCGGLAATASISSESSLASTSTFAPAAESSSAFQAAAGVPPASTTRLPASAKNTGSRASCPMRGLRVSVGVRDVLTNDDPLELRQTRPAIGAGAQTAADVRDGLYRAAVDGLADGVKA